jgi:hypothetical protein
MLPVIQIRTRNMPQMQIVWQAKEGKQTLKET